MQLWQACRFRSRILVAGLVLALAAAGCGGAGRESPGAPSAPGARTGPAPGSRGPGGSEQGPAREGSPAPGPSPGAPPAEPGTGVDGQGGRRPEAGGKPPAGTQDPAGQTPAPAPAGPVPFETLEKGYYSGLTDRAAVLVTDRAGWERLWQRHASPRVPAPRLPEIDFGAHSVIAVSLGEKSTGGYAVEVVGVERAGERLIVSVRTRSPAPGAAVTAAFSQPYHFVRIPRQKEPVRLDVRWE